MNENKNQSHDQDRPGMGNASNPGPAGLQSQEKQLINEKGEKYLREAGNIEDMPDAHDQQEAERIEENMNKKND